MEEIEIRSEKLNGNIRVGLVFPKNDCRAIFILLHGHNGTLEDMNKNLPLQDYANDYHLCIACPSLGNGYYIDKPDKQYSTFLTEDLPDLIQERFSESKPITLGGISMGGYGSLLATCQNPSKIRDVISISGAYIAHDISIGNPEVVGNPNNRTQVQYYLDTFGPDISDLDADLHRNPIAALSLLCKEKYPRIWMTCGTDDPLYSRNIRVLNAMNNNGLRYYWEPIPGNHTFSCFDFGIRKVLDAIRKQTPQE